MIKNIFTMFETFVGMRCDLRKCACLMTLCFGIFVSSSKTHLKVTTQ